MLLAARDARLMRISPRAHPGLVGADQNGPVRLREEADRGCGDC
jgi:hypothetical protein